MADKKKTVNIERIILFAVFLIFIGIVFTFVKQSNYVEDDTYDSCYSFQYVTSGSVKPNILTESNTSSGKLNINTATAEELDKLPGIGKTKAEAIVNYRENIATFITIEAVMKVEGIGQKTFSEIKQYIDVK